MKTPPLLTYSLIDYGKEVLESEAQSVSKAKEALGPSFGAACELILKSKSKLIVSGLGKSGHIARKVAATLASTGTMAYFIHPVEAMHGDLGTMGPLDLLLVFTASGETKEVIALSEYAKRLDVPVIAICGNKNSTLALGADLWIDASVDEECCPLKLAPSNSSTVALALGDALAIAIMRARGFGVSDFHRLHPAGSLGLKLAKVSEFSQALGSGHALKENSSYIEVLEKLSSSNWGLAPVVNQDSILVGCISDGDLRRKALSQKEAVFKLQARDLMNPRPKTIEYNGSAAKALSEMEKHKVTALFVKNSEDPSHLSILRLHDLLEAKMV